MHVTTLWYIFIVLVPFVIFMTRMAEGKSSSQRYIVRFEGNNSKCWDGKEVWLDAEVLNELYESSELFDGANIIVPWKGKGGKISHWNAIFIDPSVPRQGNDDRCYHIIV